MSTRPEEARSRTEESALESIGKTNNRRSGSMRKTDSVFFLKINGITPQKMRLDDLAEYMLDFSKLLGAEHSPRFYRVTKSSTNIGAAIPREDEPDTKNRLFLVKSGHGPQEALTAKENVSSRMGRNMAKGASVIDHSGSALIEIPVAMPLPTLPTSPVFTRAGSIQGEVIRLGGKQEVVGVQIEDVDGVVYPCKASRDIARKLGPYLYGKTIRVHGIGKWRRDQGGVWVIEDFSIQAIDEHLYDEKLDVAVKRLQAIPSQWKSLDDPHQALEQIRSGGDE